MAVSKNTIRKTGHCTCLREMTGQTYPTYASTKIFHAPHSTVHFLVAGSKGFKNKNKFKKLERYKVSNVGINLIHNLWEIHVISTDIDSKSSSSRCFQGHDLHHQVTALWMLLAITFFPLMIF